MRKSGNVFPPALLFVVEPPPDCVVVLLPPPPPHAATISATPTARDATASRFHGCLRFNSLPPGLVSLSRQRRPWPERVCKVTDDRCAEQLEPTLTSAYKRNVARRRRLSSTGS